MSEVPGVFPGSAARLRDRACLAAWFTSESYVWFTAFWGCCRLPWLLGRMPAGLAAVLRLDPLLAPGAGPGGGPLHQLPRHLSHISRLVTVIGTAGHGRYRHAPGRLRCKPRFARRPVAERRIRLAYVGRTPHIPESALDELIEANMVYPVITWWHGGKAVSATVEILTL